MQIKARWYQDEAVQAAIDFYSVPREVDGQGKLKPKNALICLPTGTGKSLVIGKLAQRMFEHVPNTRLMMTTHVKTLIEQNANKLFEVWPNAPAGIYSSGLKRRDSLNPIIFGGIQSCVKKYPIFGWRDFLFIDEAHLVGDEGSYLAFIAELMLTNPYLNIVGLSATPYRLGLGCLTNGKIFTDIIYDLCNIDGFNRLIAEGYLCPLIGKAGCVEIDISEVGLDSTGDYAKGELSAAIKKQNKTQQQLNEFVAYGENRRCWMVFAAGIEEAEEINDMLNNLFGVSSGVMHSKMSDAHNVGVLKAWKAGAIRCAVSMNMLTTGVDNPMCDYMGDFAPTTSTGKHVQKNGRLTRPFSEPGWTKINGMIMDYAGNIGRLGPINDPLIPRKRGDKPTAGDAPVKLCKNKKEPFSDTNPCNMFNSASASKCIFCGNEFVFFDKTTKQAWDGEVMRSDTPVIANIKVDRCIYTPHVSKAIKDANPGVNPKQLPFSIKVSYFCALRCFYEYVTVEGKGGNVRGRDWFRQRYEYAPSLPKPFHDANGELSDVPRSNAEVLAVVARLRPPSSIDVWLNVQPQPRVMKPYF